MCVSEWCAVNKHCLLHHWMRTSNVSNVGNLSLHVVNNVVCVWVGMVGVCGMCVTCRGVCVWNVDCALRWHFNTLSCGHLFYWFHKSMNQYQAWLYLSECIFHCGFKYGHEIPQFLHFLQFLNNFWPVVCTRLPCGKH